MVYILCYWYFNTAVIEQNYAWAYFHNLEALSGSFFSQFFAITFLLNPFSTKARLIRRMGTDFLLGPVGMEQGVMVLNWRMVDLDRYKEELYTVRAKHWNGLPGEVWAASSLETLKVKLDHALSNLIWLSHCKGVGLHGFWRSLPSQTILWFSDQHLFSRSTRVDLAGEHNTKETSEYCQYFQSHEMQKEVEESPESEDPGEYIFIIIIIIIIIVIVIIVFI